MSSPTSTPSLSKNNSSANLPSLPKNIDISENATTAEKIILETSMNTDFQLDNINSNNQNLIINSIPLPDEADSQSISSSLLQKESSLLIDEKVKTTDVVKEDINPSSKDVDYPSTAGDNPIDTSETVKDDVNSNAVEDATIQPNESDSQSNAIDDVINTSQALENKSNDVVVVVGSYNVLENQQSAVEDSTNHLNSLGSETNTIDAVNTPSNVSENQSNVVEDANVGTSNILESQSNAVEDIISIPAAQSGQQTGYLSSDVLGDRDPVFDSIELTHHRKVSYSDESSKSTSSHQIGSDTKSQTPLSDNNTSNRFSGIKFYEKQSVPVPDEFVCDQIASNLHTWKNKKFLGGFVNKKTHLEFFNATTQTTTPHEIKEMLMIAKAHRDTQTKFERNRQAQSNVDSFTQMTKEGAYVSTSADYCIEAKKYITAIENAAFILQTVIKLQCFIRRCFAIRVVDKKRKEKKARGVALAAKERRRKDLAEKRRRKEIESRLHPKTSKDFEILYNGLENWRIQETEKINNSAFSEPVRLTALADLLDQEAALIQKIDRLKLTANEENKEMSIVKLLDKMSAPKKWKIHGPKGGFCLVDTPNTIRARELKDLYYALNIPLLSVDERLQILLHEFDCILTRDIVELIDREGDLVSRGRHAKSLEGLRRRISNLFLNFIQTPEFNPESKAHQKFPEAGQSWKREQSVYYCRGCTKYLASTEFYLSTTMRHLGRCKLCTMKDNIANERKDDSYYVEMLKMARGQEVSKSKPKGESEEDETNKHHYNAIALLQESDVRYLVDTIWNRQSAVSGNKNIEDLVLTRWDQAEELSPWNIILLTLSEASNHESQKNPNEVYSDEFIRRVRQRHLAAKQHFSYIFNSKPSTNRI